MKKYFNKLTNWLKTTRYVLKLKSKWDSYINQESEMQSIDFKQLNLKADKEGKIFFGQQTLIDLWAQTGEEERFNQVIKEFAPSYDFLLSLMEYEDVVVPDIVVFEDEEGNEALSYGCIFSFSHKLNSLKNLIKFYGFFVASGVISLGVITGLIYLINLVTLW